MGAFIVFRLIILSIAPAHSIVARVSLISFISSVLDNHLGTGIIISLTIVVFLSVCN
ncbi:MAG: hypothetical protein WCG25_03055 [bacterium]